jgi:hypothetical protein
MAHLEQRKNIRQQGATPASASNGDALIGDDLSLDELTEITRMFATMCALERAIARGLEPRCENHVDAARACLRSDAALTDKQRAFLENLPNFARPTARQEAWLADICRKAGVKWP